MLKIFIKQMTTSFFANRAGFHACGSKADERGNQHHC